MDRLTVLLKDFKVDCKCLLDDLIVICRYFAQVETDRVSFLQLPHQLLLHFSVLLKFALFTKLLKLVVKLLRTLGRSINCLGFAFVDEDLVQYQAV